MRENAHISSNWAPVIIGRNQKNRLAGIAGCCLSFLSPVQLNWPSTKESFLFFDANCGDVIIFHSVSLSLSFFSLLFYLFSPHFFFQNGGTGAMGTIFTTTNQNPIISPFPTFFEMLPFFMSP